MDQRGRVDEHFVAAMFFNSQKKPNFGLGEPLDKSIPRILQTFRAAISFFEPANF